VSENTLDSFPNEDNRPFDLLSDNLASNDRRDPLNSLSQINSTNSTNSADSTSQPLSSGALNNTNLLGFDVERPKNNTFEGGTFAPPMPDFLGNQNNGNVSPQLYDTIADISRVTILDTFKKVTIDGVVPQISSSTIDFSLNNTPRSSDITNVGTSFSASDNLSTPIPAGNKAVDGNDFFINTLKQQNQTIEVLLKRLGSLEEIFIPPESAEETDDNDYVEKNIKDAKSLMARILYDPETKINTPQNKTTTNNIGKDVELGTTTSETYKPTTQNVSTKLSGDVVQEIKELSKEQNKNIEGIKYAPNKITPDLPETANPESVAIDDSSETANPNSRALEDSSETANPNSRELKDSSETANPNSRALKDSSETANPNSRPLKKDDGDGRKEKGEGSDKKDVKDEGTQLDAKEIASAFPIKMRRADLKDPVIAFMMSAGMDDINNGADNNLFKPQNGTSHFTTNEYWYPDVFPKMPTNNGIFVLGVNIQGETPDLLWIKTDQC
jgi:hypothetical protein